MRILYEIEDRWKAGEVDPFGNWTYPKEKKEERRARKPSLTLEKAAELFIQSRAHVGLDHRTILNRSNLDAADPRFIVSVRFGSRR